MAKSAIGSAFGFVSTITSRIIGGVKLRQAEEAILGLSEDTINKLTDEFVQKLISAAGLAENCYKVLVDCGQTLQQMIANGKYDYANSDINASNFPMQGSGQQNVVVELVHFGRDMSSEEVLKEFEARGLRAAMLPELLVFGATYPEKQREFPVIALGSVWRGRGGDRRVACLGRRGSGRGLGLGWGGGGWGVGCRFAAVRK